MNAHLYKLECLTNLHVGSGDTNYNIIDQEVERDPVTDYPIIHASGIKGALLEAAKTAGLAGADIDFVFGKGGDKNQGNPGAYRFFEAKFLTRPLRVGGNRNIAYVPVTTVQAINDFIDLTNAFGCGKLAGNISVDFTKQDSNESYKFLVSNSEIKNIEGESAVGRLDDNIIDQLKPILGDNFAIAQNFDDYTLPSVARNYLNNGVSKNLWYEEFVPHHSVLYMIVLTPDATVKLDFKNEFNIVQFGGNASVGNGFIRISEF